MPEVGIEPLPKPVIPVAGSNADTPNGPSVSASPPLKVIDPFDPVTPRRLSFGNVPRVTVTGAPAMMPLLPVTLTLTDPFARSRIATFAAAPASTVPSLRPTSPVDGSDAVTENGPGLTSGY